MDQLADAAALVILVFFVAPAASGAILGAVIWRSRRVLGACLGIVVGVALGFLVFTFIGYVMTPETTTKPMPAKPATMPADQ